MNLTETSRQQLENPTLLQDEQAMTRCRLAAELIDCGQYESASDELGDLWRGVDKRPFIDDLTQPIAAEVLLQCGALLSGMGSARNITGAQESAKDLISESQRLFELLDMPAKAAEAQSELAVCYWRLGAFDEARVTQDEAARTVGGSDQELKAKILIRRALIEIWACRYHDALEVLNQTESFFKSLSHPLKARWHGHMGIVLRRLGIAERRVDYLDRAIIEFTAAIYHCEQTRNDRYGAIARNNLAMLLYRVGRHNEAYEHLDRAASIFSKLNDTGTLAMVNESRARVLLAEHRFEEAMDVIEKVVQDFEVGGEQSCLTDALCLQATLMAKLGDHPNSLSVFQRAIEVGATAGALEHAGHAALGLIETHGSERLSDLDAYTAYRRADEFLKGTQDAEDVSRLRMCAKIVMQRLMGSQLSDSDFVLKKAVQRYEARFIEAALQRTGGKISQAALILGLSHQTLSNILKYRQNNLKDKRLPPTPRRKSILRHDIGSRRRKTTHKSVLYIENDKTLAKAVKVSLEREGFVVDVKVNGVSGLSSLKRNKMYDVLIFDNEQQGINGISLARQARELQHRRATPIIVISSDDVATESYRAGASLFLRKPDEVDKLTANVKRLLSD